MRGKGYVILGYMYLQPRGLNKIRKSLSYLLPVRMNDTDVIGNMYSNIYKEEKRTLFNLNVINLFLDCQTNHTKILSQI